MLHSFDAAGTGRDIKLTLSIDGNGKTSARDCSISTFLCVVLGLAFATGCSSEPSARELTDIALGSGELTERLEATSQLMSKGSDARDMMIELIEKSDQPTIRSVAISGLAKTNAFDEIERLIDLIDDPSPEVRLAAQKAVNHLLVTEFTLIPRDATEEDRRIAIGKIRKAYKGMCDSGMMADYIERMKRKGNALSD